LTDCALTTCFLLAANPGSGNALVELFPFLLIFAIFYFLLILPQQRQRRKTQEMLNNLKTGDRVVTTGGIYGTIVGFRDGIVQLQIANQVKVDVARGAISGLQSPESNGSSRQEDSARKEGAGKKK
jgi:preprotein translocase subunit YajC